MEKKFTRRDFIKGTAFAGGTLLVYSAGMGLARLFKGDDHSSIGSKVDTANRVREIPNDLEQLISEILNYRKRYQLSGLPKELNDEALDAAFKYDEKAAFPGFEVDLPEYEESYGMRTKNILTDVFGPEFNRLIYRVVHSGQPGHQEFDPGLRNINLTVNLHQSYKMDSIFDMLILHEGQHGINPALKNGLYDLDTLVRVSHGMWRALQKTFNYENNLYYGLILPDIKKSLAEHIAHKFVDDNDMNGLVDLRGYSFITSAMAKIAAEKGVPLKDLKFSKSVCAQLGDELFHKVVSGDITLKGELQQKWQELIEADFSEIIADMFKYALLDPDKIGNDPDIIGGVEEMIAAIRGVKKVNIEDVRAKLSEYRPEVLVRYESEKAFLDGLNGQAPNQVVVDSTPYSVPTFTTEEIAQSQEQINQQQTITDAFKYFVTSGFLPEYYSETLTTDQISIMNNYGQALSEVYETYPTLFEGRSAHNMSFDPELHIWQTRDIAVAADDSVIWNLLEDPTLLTEDYMKNMTKRTEVLVNFINNEDAFGTNNYPPNK